MPRRRVAEEGLLPLVQLLQLQHRLLQRYQPAQERQLPLAQAEGVVAVADVEGLLEHLALEFHLPAPEAEAAELLR